MPVLPAPDQDDAVRVTSGAGGLRSEEAGEGPAVVLLHGLTATRRYVLMGSRRLQRGGHRVIAYDARGHGESDPATVPDAYGYECLSSDLLAVLDAHRVTDAVLVGASMGAHTAARAALRWPERVRGLVFITPAFDPSSHGDAASLARWDALARGLREDGVEGFVAAYGPPRVPDRWRETVLTVLRQRLSAHRHLEAVADALQAVPRSRPLKDLGELGSLDMPALVIGSRDEADPGHPLAVAQQWARSLPRARLLVEEPGRSPLAWQGGQLSRLVAELDRP